MQTLIEQISNYGFFEWTLIATVLILLLVLYFFNKALLKCKDNIAELSEQNHKLKAYLTSHVNKEGDVDLNVKG